MAKNKGTVIQVMGPVLDIRFADDQLPGLLSAIEIPNGEHTIVAEVAQHIGDNVVRCVAMSSTDGLQRGTEATDTGAPISVPVGEGVPWDVYLTCWVSPLTTKRLLPGRRSAGPSTVLLPPTRSSSPLPRFWKPASRSST